MLLANRVISVDGNVTLNALHPPSLLNLVDASWCQSLLQSPNVEWASGVRFPVC